MRTLNALLTVCGSWYFNSQLEFSSRALNAYKELLTDGVFPVMIGCNMVTKIFLEIFYMVPRKLSTFPGLSTWPANSQIYIGTAFDGLVCYVSLLRVNLSYLCVAIFPAMGISFIWVLWVMHNRVSRRGDVRSGSSTDNGMEGTQIPEKFNKVALVAPHFILCVVGMLGDPDHDGNNYDISNFFLFLTCMLLELTLMMVRLPPSTSRGIEPASELLYKASLLVLLLTAHVVAADAFGKEVVLLLLPEVVPLLLWSSLHLDRRNPIIDVQNIMDSEHLYLNILVPTILGYILVVPNDETWFFRLYWASMSLFTSGLMTCTIALVLHLWPENVDMATLSYGEALEILIFWGLVLLKASVGLFAFGGVFEINGWSAAVVSK